MQIYFRYMCDFGHQWVLRREDGMPEDPKDLKCIEGHEAVTRQREFPADEVQILISPAKRIVDVIKNQTIHDHQYWIALLDSYGIEISRSESMYSWDETVSIGGLFRGKSLQEAQKWWSRKKP